MAQKKHHLDVCPFLCFWMRTHVRLNSLLTSHGESSWEEGGDDVAHLDGRVVAEDVELALARMDAEVAFDCLHRSIHAWMTRYRRAPAPRGLHLAATRDTLPPRRFETVAFGSFFASPAGAACGFAAATPAEHCCSLRSAVTDVKMISLALETGLWQILRRTEKMP